MIVNATSACLTLLPGQVTRLQLRAGTRLRGLRSTAWLTADGDDRDILLDPRDEWVLDRDHWLLACALRADGRAVLQLDEQPVVAPSSPPVGKPCSRRRALGQRLQAQRDDPGVVQLRFRTA